MQDSSGGGLRHKPTSRFALAFALAALALALALALGLAAPGMALADEVGGEGDKLQTLSTSEVVASGTCGDNLTWTLTEDGTLTISGTGAMDDYSSHGPWYTYRDSVNNVVIGSGVTSIGYNAFSNCTTLESASIPASVVSIGAYAFAWCSSLASVSIPDGVTSIGEGVFFRCTSLVTVSIPDTVTSIGDGAFRYCTSLSSVSIPDGVTSIGSQAFYCCTSLESVSIPTGVTNIGYGAFCYCTSLTSVELADGLLKIPSYVFQYCTSLSSVSIPGSVTSIGSYAFRYCTSLATLTLTNAVDGVDTSAFDGCTSLSDVYFVGTSYEWDELSSSVSSGNDCLTGADIHYLDVWSFANSLKGDWADVYYLTEEDFETLASGISASEYASIAWRVSVGLGALQTWTAADWAGSCYGMSAWVLLVASGALEASDAVEDAEGVSDLSCSLPVQSSINFYQMQEYLDSTYSACVEFMSLSQASQLAVMESMIESGSAVLITFQWYEANSSGLVLSGGEAVMSGHAVVGYAVEEGDYTEYVESYLGDRTLGREFTHRVLVYDPAYPGGGEKYYLYYTDDGVWCIPGYYAISTSSGEVVDQSAYDNAILNLVTASAEVVDAVDYVTGEASSYYQTSEDLLNLLSCAMDGYTVSWGSNTAVIDGYSVLENTSGEDIYVIVDAGLAVGGSGSATATAVLPDADEYEVESEDEEISLSFSSGDTVTIVEADASGIVTISASGGASVVLEEEADVVVSVTADGGCAGTGWTTLTVTAEDVDGLTVELTDEGLVIEGDDLTGVTVEAGDAGEGAEAELVIESSGAAVTVTESEGELVAAEGTAKSSASSSASSYSFEDAQDASKYYYSAIYAVADAGIMTGLGDGTTFGVGKSLNRQQMVVILYRIFATEEEQELYGSTESGYSSVVNLTDFEDVEDGKYYTAAVNWAYATGVTTGKTATHFGVGEECTFQQFCTFLARAICGGDSALEAAVTDAQAEAALASFSDASSVSSYARKAIAYLCGVEYTDGKYVVEGKSDGTVAPGESVKRERAATVVYRCLAAGLLG